MDGYTVEWTDGTRFTAERTCLRSLLVTAALPTGEIVEYRQRTPKPVDGSALVRATNRLVRQLRCGFPGVW